METTMKYLARSPILAVEKAFDTDFPVDNVEGARKTNHTGDPRTVLVHPIADRAHWDLDVHGFSILKAKTDLGVDDAFDRKEEVKKAYWYEIEAILHEAYPRYSRIESYDFTVRRRDPDFPRVQRQYGRYEQPSMVPHADYSTDGARMVLSHSFPGQEKFWEDKEFDLINVWRPLTGPNNDWPLAMCDWTTVDPEADVCLNDAIRRDRVDENSLLHYNPAHRWYYIEGQGVDDLLVFRNADSIGNRARAFHCAVSGVEDGLATRHSVEVRLVAFY